MHKKISQVRDLGMIEKELSENLSGVLALNIENDKLIQVAVTYIYLDKNIYIFFREENEFYENIQFGSNVAFTVSKNQKVRKNKSLPFDPAYGLLSVTVSGMIRKVEDQKLIEDLRQSYARKYEKVPDGNIDEKILNKIVIVDSEEIQAFEEIGG
jgi:nitroimidazol reductase NimA-like FMN-containing flavoprotein (pyridoxamine 5'-phosphate oxidase superfamily)